MKDQGEMFPTLTGEQLRNRALKQVGENAGVWKDNALLMALFELELRHGQIINGERLRHIVYEKIGPPPNHPNAWGKVFSDVLRKFPGLLVMVGIEKPKDPRSKASRKPTYRINAHWRGQP